jgi:hypothetical protein
MLSCSRTLLLLSLADNRFRPVRSQQRSWSRAAHCCDACLLHGVPLFYVKLMRINVRTGYPGFRVCCLGHVSPIGIASGTPSVW